MQQKEEFVKLAQEEGANISELCLEFGISRVTGYSLLKRYRNEGARGLKAKSRKPKSSPFKTSHQIEELILATRALHPGWGGDKLRTYLLRLGHQEMPTEKTIDRILKRNGLITAEESEKHTAWIRFEHEKPNALWQMDFKGHFEIGNGRCFPLTLLDDHSRFSILIKSCQNQQSDTVKTALISTFREHGLPERMTMDNGAPWGYSGTQKYTKLSAWLIRNGIKVSHSRPLHPQTQGKLERFHRTLKLELLSRYAFKNLEEAQEGFDWWREIYNEQRPHAAIDLEVPASRYLKSERGYNENFAPIEYDSSFAVRKVQLGGIIFFNGKTYRVGDAFHGDPIGLKESETDGLMDVYYCHQKVVIIDLKHPLK